MSIMSPTSPQASRPRKSLTRRCSLNFFRFLFFKLANMLKI